MAEMRGNLRAALLRAVVEYPEDHLPRLAYADWLEEFGTPADLEMVPFIRAEYAPPDVAFRRRTKVMRPWHRYAATILRDLMPRSHQLFLIEWPGHGRSAGRSFPASAGGCHFCCAKPPFVITLRYGFVENVSVSVWWFRRSAGELFASQPVRNVVLNCHFWPERDFGFHYWSRGGLRNWHDGGWRLPPEIFDRLLAPRTRPAGASRLLPSEAAFYSQDGLAAGDGRPATAYEDLSQALVSWGREKARTWREVAALREGRV